MRARLEVAFDLVSSEVRVNAACERTIDMMPEGPRPIAAELLTRLPNSPDVYPQKLDFVREMALLVQLNAAAYRTASFLDDRVLTPTTKGTWVSAGLIAEAARRVQCGRPLNFIFHTGHVGSTLVSRLLDETGLVLSLREPMPLRTFANARDVLGKPDSLLSQAEFDAALDVFIRLWSRGYEPTRCVVVKATSSAGRMAAPLLRRQQNARAIYLNLQAEPFLAALLGGANSAQDLRGHSPERMRRLQSFVGEPLTPLHQLSIGEVAALSWLTESFNQREAVKGFPGRVVALDFDRFLSAVPATMAQIIAHFGLPHDARFLETIEQSPALTRYAKAPEHAYSRQLRAQVMADSRQRNGEEIAKGMAWLERAARANAAVDEILRSTGA